MATTTIQTCTHSIYIDWEDTLLIDGKINPQMIQLIYQVKNQGKRLYLFKPDSVDISDYYISTDLFDGVYSDGTETKIDMIHESALLIDDSFEVRKAAHEKGIKVFDVDAIESLVDWRM